MDFPLRNTFSRGCLQPHLLIPAGSCTALRIQDEGSKKKTSAVTQNREEFFKLNSALVWSIASV